MSHRIHRVYKYHQWANSRFFSHLAQLPNEVYHQKVKSVFSSVSEVMEHLYQTDKMWLSVMSGDSFEQTMKIIHQAQKQSQGSSLAETQQLFEALYLEYLAFFKKRGDLDEVIQIEHPQFGRMETPVAELVQHVVNHGTYHRGNITAILRQLGETGVPTDYIFYLQNHS